MAFRARGNPLEQLRIRFSVHTLRRSSHYFPLPPCPEKSFQSLSFLSLPLSFRSTPMSSVASANIFQRGRNPWLPPPPTSSAPSSSLPYATYPSSRIALLRRGELRNLVPRVLPDVICILYLFFQSLIRRICNRSPTLVDANL